MPSKYTPQLLYCHMFLSLHLNFPTSSVVLLVIYFCHIRSHATTTYLSPGNRDAILGSGIWKNFSAHSQSSKSLGPTQLCIELM
jgi:hypothetical protein